MYGPGVPARSIHALSQSRGHHFRMLRHEFGMEFPYEDLEKIKTVGDAVNYIEQKKA